MFVIQPPYHIHKDKGASGRNYTFAIRGHTKSAERSTACIRTHPSLLYRTKFRLPANAGALATLGSRRIRYVSLRRAPKTSIVRNLFPRIISVYQLGEAFYGLRPRFYWYDTHWARFRTKHICANNLCIHTGRTILMVSNPPLMPRRTLRGVSY